MNYANPIYDTAFKGLIRDKEIAKEIIGTLLETEVIDVELNITEWNKPIAGSDDVPRSIRLDYCATILDDKGEQKKVLIEIQKTSKPYDILRFREYLAIAGYGAQTNKRNDGLPIVTFYFLGFELDNIHTPCLRVARQYFDMIDKKVLDTKERFVELLTHDSYIIQIPRIKNVEKPVSKLCKILSIFEQNMAEEDDHTTLFYRFPIEDEFMRMMLGKLYYVIADPEVKKEIINEEYWLREDVANSEQKLELEQKIIEIEEKDAELGRKDAVIGQKDAVIEEKDAELGRKDIVIGQKDAVIGQKDVELEQKDIEIEQHKVELDEMKKRLIEYAKDLKSFGMSIEDISRKTGLSVEEIDKM